MRLGVGRRWAAISLAAMLIGALLQAGPARATLPGTVTDLYVVEYQLDSNGASSGGGLTRYNSDGSFGGGGARCGDAGTGLTLATQSRTWVGTSSWGTGSFVACNDANGDADIYFIPEGFNGSTKVTNFSGDHYDPAVSADGSQLAFSSDTEGRRQICLLGYNDTAPDCVTGNTHAGEDWAPVWDPHDSSRIVFVSTVDGDADLYQWAPGGDYADWYNFGVTDNDTNDFGPDFSPTTLDVIVYSSNVGGIDQVFTVNINTREPQQLTEDTSSNFEPVYSPDGSQIAFVKQASAPGSYGRVYLMPATGGSSTALSGQTDATREYTHPEWVQGTGSGCEPNCEAPHDERGFASFRLVRHLKATGQLFSDSGADACLVGQPVKIQKKKAGVWRTIKTVTTGATGSFRTSVPDRPGSYRGKVGRADVGEEGSPWLCTGATSAAKRHRH